MTRQRHPIAQVPSRLVYDTQPWLVYWELTRACGLACRHCRAEAMDYRDPRELTFQEGKQLLGAIRRFGSSAPHVVITGGDPLWRPDLFSLIAYGRQSGLGISLAPSVTERLNRSVFKRCRELGVNTVSLSIDGAEASRHDGVRGIPGCFARTLDMCRVAKEEGLALQVNTLVTAESVSDLSSLYRLVGELGAIRWSLFFLIGVGRGTGLQEPSPEQAEEVCRWLSGLISEAPFDIKTTEAPHFRRVLIQQWLEQGHSMRDVRALSPARGFGVRDGNGIVFISHTGDVHPSGFLPVAAGNVRDDDLVDLYRHSLLFRDLRDTDAYEGKCGRCEYRKACGGSRARAYASTGNPMASDPLCAYQPRGRKPPVVPGTPPA